MDLHPGVYVTDNIRLKRRLGEGGMASVWVGEHLTLRIDVAVKFIAPDLVGQAPDLVARFNREATAVARIRSPHVVQVLDHGMTADGTPYIVMELLEGEDLGARLDREGSLPLADVVTILTQVGKALTRAHQAGIVHRDIKPDNIFLVRTDEEGELFAKVLDFGIAKDTQQASRSVVTISGTMVGTPAYMSPEQVLSGKHADARADLWALGVVAYHAMTGEVPFEGSTLGALCVAISRGVFQEPSYLEPRLPHALDAWMARALAVSPDDRFQTVKEMLDAFREAARSSAPTVDEVAAYSRPSSEFERSGEAADDWEPPPSSSVPPGMRGAPALTGANLAPLPTRRVEPRVLWVGGLALVVGILATAAITRPRAALPGPSQGVSGSPALSSSALLASPERSASREAALPTEGATDEPRPPEVLRPGEVVDAPAPEASPRRRSTTEGGARARKLATDATTDAAAATSSAAASPPEPPAPAAPSSAPTVPTDDGAASSVDRGF
ncbi:MAG: serine/threonine protein kinase [Deltaproteobacteria bacterium]|nr:serine/threonine protein kinase [Deltaproteobacteria bacterium]